jgi:D-tyrosyl-tRNA(Tyr) deacylase
MFTIKTIFANKQTFLPNSYVFGQYYIDLSLICANMKAVFNMGFWIRKEGAIWFYSPHSASDKVPLAEVHSPGVWPKFMKGHDRI